VGLGFGLVAALALTRLATGLLFGVSPTDPLTLVCITLLLFGVALAAAAIPAQRATRIDPIIAMRRE